ncbi:MAG TPA: L-seryl-tRNA(Sec) selenium transferase [Myxococcota bacterium]|nr:L-seryl-tRNA(Sec) selenium transferase [Myxococcota bacterium]
MNSEGLVKPDLRRSLPSVDRLVRALETSAPGFPRWAALEAAREALSEARTAMSGEAAPPTLEALAEAAALRAHELSRPRPERVLNATGIVLHTNLGRAPLAPGAAQAIARAACGYTDLELDLDSGNRGNRSDAVVEKLRLLAGAPDAVVVNNNAAALLLVLATLARDREVVVSRGQLVEIGGSFRVPEILASAGARLVEVGTTNRTHLPDYERAIGSATAVLLKVHRSNFAQHGFVAEAGLPELAALARARGLVLVEDLGSGTLIDLADHGFPPESFAPTRLRAGAEIVCFSGDKLLGGPQAGIALTASATHAQAMRRNPLARALRLDKLALAGLDWTLSTLLEGRAQSELPVLRRLLEPEAELERRALALAERIRIHSEALEAEALRDVSYAGGGSLPELALATWVVALRAPIAAAELSQRLRRGHPPVLGRIRDGRVILDLRSLEPEDEKPIEEALRSALR